MYRYQSTDSPKNDVGVSIAVIQVIKDTFCKKSVGIVLLLGALAFVSALAVVYVKTDYRNQFIHLQKLVNQKDQLETTYSQMLLEESTWARYARVQKIAEGELNMVVPQAKNIRVIKI